MNEPISWKPLTDRTFRDLIYLMGGETGGCGGCWCTWWWLPRAEWSKKGKQGRLDTIQQLVCLQKPVGVILYDDDAPKAWCAVSPYKNYVTMHHSPVSRYDLDDETWCISCIFVRAGFRRKGLMSSAIVCGAEYAFSSNARRVIGFPQIDNGRTGYVDRFVGTEASFMAAGFRRIEGRGPNRALVELKDRSET
jgi:hypothetical protein